MVKRLWGGGVGFCCLGKEGGNFRGCLGGVRDLISKMIYRFVSIHIYTYNKTSANKIYIKINYKTNNNKIT